MNATDEARLEEDLWSDIADLMDKCWGSPDPMRKEHLHLVSEMFDEMSDATEADWPEKSARWRWILGDEMVDGVERLMAAVEAAASD
jgi:hypothetical protein